MHVIDLYKLAFLNREIEVGGVYLKTVNGKDLRDKTC